MPPIKTNPAFYWIAFCVFVIFSIVLGVAVFTDFSKDPLNDRKDQIRACIAAGGDPKYVVDKDGYIIEYFGCVM
jgi:hypothetical protein